jgi:glutaredoxin 3
MPKVVVYTANPCPFCSRAKALLKERGIAYEEIHLDYDDEPAWDALTKKSGLMTVPQIFADDRLIGGFTDLAALDQRDRLVSLK